MIGHIIGTTFFLFFQAMSVEAQDSIFGQENSVATAQSTSQAQLPEPENKLDDSIDNQQQVCLTSMPLARFVLIVIYTSVVFIYFWKCSECLNLGVRELAKIFLFNRNQDPQSKLQCFFSIFNCPLDHCQT